MANPVVATWGRRPLPDDLAKHYFADGHWTDDTLGGMVETGLAGMANATFNVRSKVRPFRGTLGDIDKAARGLATSWQERGLGPGSVVVAQMPNWAEAGIAFWAACYLGAVVVPIVHFYGREGSRLHRRRGAPRRGRHARNGFGYTDHLAMYSELLAGSDTTWLVVGDTPTSALPAGATALRRPRRQHAARRRACRSTPTPPR